MLFIRIYLILAISLLVSSCGSSSSSKTPPNTSNSWYKPKPATSWQWQLLGTVNTAYDVEIYDIDLFDSSQTLIQQLQADNKKVICYFSAGSYENWRSDSTQFKSAELGKALDGWEGERWLDIRSNNVRNIIKNRLKLAKQKGCDGVEPDNVDGYANKSGFALTANNQLDFNRFIAKEAHARGLSVGLKNDLDQIHALINDFDFAVNEQCFEFDECELLTPFIQQGKAVLNAEYKKDHTICNQSKQMKFSTLLLPLDLNDHFRHSCL